MTDEGSDFWNKHSARYLEMAFRFDKRNPIENPDGYGKRTGECGDTVEIFLTVKNDHIQQLTFDIHGCQNTNACCNVVVHLLEGKQIRDAWNLTPEDVADFLETLPESHFHCAELVVGTLYQALNNYSQLRRASWKKAYAVRK